MCPSQYSHPSLNLGQVAWYNISTGTLHRHLKCIVFQTKHIKFPPEPTAITTVSVSVGINLHPPVPQISPSTSPATSKQYLRTANMTSLAVFRNLFLMFQDYGLDHVSFGSSDSSPCSSPVNLNFPLYSVSRESYL